MQTKRLITVCVPVFNEAENLVPFYEAILPVFDQVADRYDFELLFTDNHSTDCTFEILEQLSARDSRIRVLRFSRNFGFQRSIATAYAHARGDAAIQIDCDLQDPPAMILEFIQKWESGYHIVYGVRAARAENWWMNGMRKTFYRLIDFLSEDDLPLDAGDFRLLDRAALNELAKFEDDQPYLRGAIAALGFEQVGIPYTRGERVHGESKFSFRQLMGLALDGILNHSVVPLRIATYLGLAVSLITLLAMVAYTVGRIFFARNWPSGFASIVILILASLSLNALFLGIIGEYLGRIYRQIKRRPLTIVEREIGGELSTLPSANDSETAAHRELRRR